MKKISFVAAILVSAALAGACHKNKPAATTPAGGSDMGSSMGSGSAMGSGDMGSAAGSGGM